MINEQATADFGESFANPMQNRLSVARIPWLALLLITLTGCASKTMQNPAAQRDLIFPFGVYQHEVDLTMAAPAAVTTELLPAAGAVPKQVHFHGVVKLNADVINMIALSPLNTTLFRIHEDRKSSKIDTDIYIESLQKLRPQLIEYYQLMRLILTAPLATEESGVARTTRYASGANAGWPEQTVVPTNAGAATVRYREYDKNKVPSVISIDNPKFTLLIQVSGYAL